jgi:hypothetical protein
MLQQLLKLYTIKWHVDVSEEADMVWKESIVAGLSKTSVWTVNHQTMI